MIETGRFAGDRVPPHDGKARPMHTASWLPKMTQA